MICQIKRDSNTNEIVEVLDSFGRKSKVFDKYVKYFSDTIDDSSIAKEEAAKSYILSNSTEDMIKLMSNPPSKGILPITEETSNEFLELENKDSLLTLVDRSSPQILTLKYHDPYEDLLTYSQQYQLTSNYLKRKFIDLGYDTMDVQQLSDLYISSIVNEETDPGVFYYSLAAVTKDKQMQNFIYNNLPLYDNFTKVISTLNDYYELSETVDPSRYNYTKKQGKLTSIAPEESRINIDKAKENIRAILGDAV
jgi:hypothetical protein